MRYAVISDIHSNLEALTSVLKRIDDEGVDEIVCLGDLVGYHANPNECIALIRERGIRCIAGNHDRAAAGLKEPDCFGEAARRAILWTRGHLSQDNRRFLETLPLFEVIGDDTLIVHAGVYPRPNEDVRIKSADDIIRNFEAMDRLFPRVRVCFVGHAHRSVVHRYCDSMLTRVDGQTVSFERSARYLVNPGSVGQSRDADPRAAFLVFDCAQNSVSFHRVEYDWDSCFEKAERAGLLYKETRLRKSVNWITARIAIGENIVKEKVVRRFL